MTTLPQWRGCTTAAANTCTVVRANDSTYQQEEGCPPPACGYNIQVMQVRAAYELEKGLMTNLPALRLGVLLVAELLGETLPVRFRE